MHVEYKFVADLSNIQGHGFLTEACYTASTGIVVFRVTHSTSPFTNFMKFQFPNV